MTYTTDKENKIYQQVEKPKPVEETLRQLKQYLLEIEEEFDVISS